MNSRTSLVQHDHDISLRLNQLGRTASIRRILVWVSRLGDGPIWYLLVLGLPLFLGSAYLSVSLCLSLSTLSGIWVYKRIKAHYRRPRPYQRDPLFHAHAVALDEYSFPSGHTLHATSCSLILIATVPTLGLCFLPFALATAVSRIVLGMHYVSDVVAGAIVGLLTGAVWLTAARITGIIVGP